MGNADYDQPFIASKWVALKVQVERVSALQISQMNETYLRCSLSMCECGVGMQMVL